MALAPADRDRYLNSKSGRNPVLKWVLIFLPFTLACSLFCFISLHSVFALGCLEGFRSMVVKANLWHSFTNNYRESSKDWIVRQWLQWESNIAWVQAAGKVLRVNKRAQTNKTAFYGRENDSWVGSARLSYFFLLSKAREVLGDLSAGSTENIILQALADTFTSNCIHYAARK